MLQSLLESIDRLGPTLEEASPKNEELGELAPEVMKALRALDLPHLLVPKSLGGLEASPTEALDVFDRVAYFDGAAGWVVFVHASAGGFAAGYLPESATKRLFPSGKLSVFAGQGAPNGTAERVEGGYRVSGHWSYGSGIKHADYSHSGALLVENGKPKLDAAGHPTVLCVHPSAKDLTFAGNWDVLGLQGSGSVDYIAKDAFVPDDAVFPIFTAKPQRNPGFFGLGVVAIAAIGHSGWCLGASRRILDELERHSKIAKGRSKPLATSESFQEDFARVKARVLSARAFVYSVWSDIEKTIDRVAPISEREQTMLRLALCEVYAAGVEAANFAYKVAGGTSLRQGMLQRLFREMHTANQHVTVGNGVWQNCGKELLGTPGAWVFYELVGGG